ncbi:MAG: hypothetical protein AB4058_17960 [Microcystaceae cyanobacterium]
MQLSIQLLPDIAQRLDHHEEALRIKKLIFCLCKKYWENDPNVLNTFSFEDLLTQLLNARPTIEQLTFSLYKLVKTLNRPKVYAAVAKVILDQVTPLYDHINEGIEESEGVVKVETIEHEATPIEIEKETQMVDPNFLIQQVTHQLTSHRENSRIKKLVYCLCQNRWENDLGVIDHYGVNNLLSDICQIYPTQRELKTALQRIVDNLNKQSLYLAIANIILDQLNVLYNNLAEESLKEKEGSTQIYNTQIIQLNSINVPQRNDDSSQEFETSVIDLAAEQGITELKQIAISPVVEAVPEEPIEYDLFEIRENIFQYTNPLRAKILLFSLLFHQWDKSGQDWSMLRSYTFDDLMEQLLEGGHVLDKIDHKLQKTAKAMNDSDLHIQAASTIVETIRPYFPNN